mgnify:CR=1 FL=1
MSDQYIAGTCNIGKNEIRQRQFVALVGLVLSVSSLIGFITTGASQSVRLGIFLPLTVFAIGWVQSRKKFCLAYGFMGTFNFGKIGQLSRVQDKDAKRADRATALSILFQAVLYATLATVAMYLLPTSI